MGRNAYRTPLRTTARRLERATHTRGIISACNSVLIRATNEAELLRGICRIAIHEGTLAMAWIGYDEHGPGKPVRPVAHAGVGAEYVSAANATWDADGIGRGAAREVASFAGLPSLSSADVRLAA